MTLSKSDDDMHSGRRAFLGMTTAALALASGEALALETSKDAGGSTGGPLSDVPIVLPKTEFVYEAICTLQDPIEIGSAPLGGRRMINITGGEFAGSRLKGKVLPGGADRQLLRADGIRQLDALYELQTDDGAIITVHNKVLIDAPKDGPRYAFSVLEITAPTGPHDWLNRRVFVGTLTSMRPEPKVLIRVFSLV